MDDVLRWVVNLQTSPHGWRSRSFCIYRLCQCISYLFSFEIYRDWIRKTYWWRGGTPQIFMCIYLTIRKWSLIGRIFFIVKRWPKSPVRLNGTVDYILLYLGVDRVQDECHIGTVLLLSIYLEDERLFSVSLYTHTHTLCRIIRMNWINDLLLFSILFL